MQYFQHEHPIRVRYGETDQMGYVYYGNYATYFEVARVEALRSLGISYRSLEEQGIMMPVKSYRIDFKLPCKYDEMLTIRTEIREIPETRIRFHYFTFNECGELVNEAFTELYFMDGLKKRPVRVPEFIKAVLSSHLK
jgi:acyl-CoA thioester hydrolase